MYRQRPLHVGATVYGMYRVRNRLTDWMTSALASKISVALEALLPWLGTYRYCKVVVMVACARMGKEKDWGSEEHVAHGRKIFKQSFEHILQQLDMD